MSEKNQRFVRVCESLPPVTADVEYHDPEVRDAECSTGKFVRVCESLPPVTVDMEEVPAALELVPAVAEPADATGVTAAVAGLMRDVFLAGQDLIDWTGVRVGSPRPGVVTLTLVSNGPEAEERLRELARRVASPTVTATVIPAA